MAKTILNKRKQIKRKEGIQNGKTLGLGIIELINNPPTRCESEKRFQF